MILYLLALGSPTHPVPARRGPRGPAATTGARSTATRYVHFPPLFGHQYSHCWVDFRDIRTTLHAATTASPTSRTRAAPRWRSAPTASRIPAASSGYSDTPVGAHRGRRPAVGYAAHGAPPAQNDNGTITPTAAVSSIAFAPEICIPAIRTCGTTTASRSGAVRIQGRVQPRATPTGTTPTCSASTRGRSCIMIENYRTARCGTGFMQNPEIQRGLNARRFRATWSQSRTVRPGDRRAAMSGGPNPFAAGRPRPALPSCRRPAGCA